MNKQVQGAFAAALVLFALAGCKKETAAEPAEVAQESAKQAEDPAVAEIDLRDVVENTPRYVVGISYPAAVANYPGLARELLSYSSAAKAELMEAVDVLGNDKPTAPYELSLSYELLVDTPTIVAVSADGSRYTGGAHGEPLVARFVWLPKQQKQLEATHLLPSAQAWSAIGAYVGARLREQAVAHAESDALSPEEQQAQVRNLSKMIDEGTAPQPQNYSQFQPVMDASGHIAAIRFVFPPYQVGPYSDGTQSVDVPAAELMSFVAPEYRELFAHP